MTIASNNGVVYGKQYKIHSPLQDYTHGGVYELDRDDGTNLPYFKLVKGEVGVHDDHACIFVDGTGGATLTEVVESATLLKNFIIDVTDVETTVRVGKLLSAGQLKRIIEILGE